MLMLNWFFPQYDQYGESIGWLALLPIFVIADISQFLGLKPNPLDHYVGPNNTTLEPAFPSSFDANECFPCWHDWDNCPHSGCKYLAEQLGVET